MSHPSLYEERPAVVTRVESMPQLRVRIAHSHTIKEGWRLSETTVEWTGSEPTVGEYEAFRYAIEGALRDAHAMGAVETERRRKSEAVAE